MIAIRLALMLYVCVKAFAVLPPLAALVVIGLAAALIL